MGNIRLDGFGENPSALIFLHIPKCAGSTVEGFLEEHFEHCFRVNNGWDYNELLKEEDFLKKERVNIAIFGTGVIGIHEILPDFYDCHYVTFLRNPFKRAISEIVFDQTLGLRTSDKSLQDELEAMVNVNEMLNIISDGHLPLALRRIESEFSFIGFVEDMDHSMKKLAEYIFGSNVGNQLSYRTKNVNKTRPDHSKISDETFKAQNRPDYLIFQKARDRFGVFAEFTNKSIPKGKIEYHPGLINILNKKGDIVDQSRNLEARLMVSDGISEDDKIQALILSLKKHAPQKAIFYYKKLVERNCAFAVSDFDLPLTSVEKKQIIHMALKKLPKTSLPASDIVIVRNKQALLRKLGVIYQRDGNSKKALALLKAAYGLNPSNWFCTVSYSAMLRLNGQPTKALALIQSFTCSMTNWRSYISELIANAYPIGGSNLVKSVIKSYVDPVFITELKRGAAQSNNRLVTRTLVSYPLPMNILVFKSAPDAICNELFSILFSIRSDSFINYCGQRNLDLTKKYAFSNCYLMTKNYFDPKEAQEMIMRKQKFQLIILPINHIKDIANYKNYISFIQHYSPKSELALFSIVNLFLPLEDKVFQFSSLYEPIAKQNHE